jgi:phosphoserine phosphatase
VLGLLLGLDGADATAVAGSVRSAALGLGLDVAVVPGADGRPRRPTARDGARLAAAADDVGALATRIAALGGNIDRIRRIAAYPVTAIVFEVSGAEPTSLRLALAEEAAHRDVDVAVQRAGLHRRGQHLVVMDVDSTLIQDEVIELIAAHAGVEEEVAAVTEAAMRGELDFAESLHRRVAALAGLDASALDQVRAQIRLTPGARTLCRTLKRLGYHVALVSGGFVEVIEPLARELGVDHLRANRLEVVDGRLTGRLEAPWSTGRASVRPSRSSRRCTACR